MFWTSSASAYGVIFPCAFHQEVRRVGKYWTVRVHARADSCEPRLLDHIFGAPLERSMTSSAHR